MKKILLILGILAILVFSGCTSTAPTNGTPAEEEGLSEELKKEVYFELVKYQDTISFDDSDYANKQQQAYSVIAERYSIEESEVRAIAIEGSKELWPIPPAP